MRAAARQGALALVALAAGCGAPAAHAGSVVLTGTIGARAILVVDGGAPKTLAPGESFRSVRLVALQGDQALVEADGRRVTLRMDVPVSVGGAGGTRADGQRIVLNADSRGHFMAPGAINGRSVHFMLDTGATTVALSAADAARIGLDLQGATPVQMNTANGVATGWRLRLASVRVGDVEVHDVEAIVSPQPMPYALLGNSFIGRFSMRRDAEQMVLDRRF